MLESPPSGPAAFWCLRDHVSNDNALVVALHADVSLRNELGMTLLHAAVAKRRLDGKRDVIATLLSRGVDVSARDFEGSTARDYVTIHRVRVRFSSNLDLGDLTFKTPVANEDAYK